MVKIGAKVRSARTTQCWSQGELAERAGLSRPTIARIEAGRDVSTATLAKVAATLGLTVRVERES